MEIVRLRTTLVSFVALDTTANFLEPPLCRMLNRGRFAKGVVYVVSSSVCLSVYLKLKQERCADLPFLYGVYSPGKAEQLTSNKCSTVNRYSKICFELICKNSSVRAKFISRYIICIICNKRRKKVLYTAV